MAIENPRAGLAQGSFPRRLLLRSSLELSSLWPTRPAIAVMRKLHGVQLTTAQLSAVAAAVRKRARCKLLVFGLGNDSLFWLGLNQGGVTVFLEDNLEWFHRITKRSKKITAFMVKYDTRLCDWRSLIESPASLNMALPRQVTDVSWDVVLVDAPEGWRARSPGRMKSIYLTSRLVSEPADVFVHDCNRVIEDAHCSKYLGEENLVAEIRAPVGYLRHYHITTRSPPTSG